MIKVRASLTVFDPSVVKTDDKMSFTVSTIAGKSLEKLTETAEDGTETVICEVPEAVEIRVRNLIVGATILLRQVGGATFSTFLPLVVAEIANNSLLYEKIIVGDASLNLSRLSKGDYQISTIVDFRGFLDFLPSMSFPVGGVAGGGTEEEVEVDF